MICSDPRFDWRLTGNHWRITVKRNSFLLYTTVIALVPGFASAQTWLQTDPAATSYYGGALINFQNTSADTLQLTGLFDLNLAGNGGTTSTYQVYVKNGALVGNEMSAAAWSLLGEATTTINAQGTFTTINVGNTYDVAAGSTVGLAFFLTSEDNGAGYVGYRSGSGTFSDSNATVTTGIVKGYRGGYNPNFDNLFNLETFTPRTWSGRVEYQAVPEPATLTLLGVGLAGLIARRRRNRN